MRNFYFLTALCLFLAGCWTMPPHEPVDYREMPDGRVQIKDTARTWNHMNAQIKRHLQNEKSGGRPQGGSSDWNNFWIVTFETWRGGVIENPEKYVGYVLQQRRELYLPELNLPAGGT